MLISCIVLVLKITKNNKIEGKSNFPEPSSINPTDVTTNNDDNDQDSGNSKPK
jgi:hypothetical protein